MLGALAVALALTSPLPPAKPLPASPPVEAATAAPVEPRTGAPGTAQPVEEPASDAGDGTVPAGPPPRPRRLATRAGRLERETEPAAGPSREPSAAGESDAAGDSVALAPIPKPRPGPAGASGPDAAAVAVATAPAATAPVEPADRAATDAAPAAADEPAATVAPEAVADATLLPTAPVPVPAERPALAEADSVPALAATITPAIPPAIPPAITPAIVGSEVPGQATAPSAIAAALPAEAVSPATEEALAAPAPTGTAPTGTALTGTAHDGAAPPAPVPAERPSFIARALVAEGPESELAAAADGAEAAVAGATMPSPPERPERPGTAAEAAPVIRAMLGIPRKPDVPGFGGMTPPGMICRDPRIVGAPAASFVGGIPGCGIPDPVRVQSIAGIRISEPALIDCRTARAFADWLTGVADPAAREGLGSGIRSVSTMGSYTCRTRNNKRGERLSEHSVGRAIDIGGVTLADGRRITVRDQWGSGAAGTFLRRAWKGACGRFTTVIGPEGDRHHYDHLHLDTAYRDSTWCR